jgi:hypothetical protein
VDEVEKKDHNERCWAFFAMYGDILPGISLKDSCLRHTGIDRLKDLFRWIYNADTPRSKNPASMHDENKTASTQRPKMQNFA